ncbi:MAG: hypothetical protein KME55_22900 [Nostoc indistinguendum CM1-VF10]|nr:hypothetical protein [Nostoc indistinguendum CM1-VF10]
MRAEPTSVAIKTWHGSPKKRAAAIPTPRSVRLYPLSDIRATCSSSRGFIGREFSNVQFHGRCRTASRDSRRMPLRGQRRKC